LFGVAITKEKKFFVKKGINDKHLRLHSWLVQIHKALVMLRVENGVTWRWEATPNKLS
jgi:hypothetical protein